MNWAAMTTPSKQYEYKIQSLGNLHSCLDMPLPLILEKTVYLLIACTGKYRDGDSGKKGDREKGTSTLSHCL